MSSKPIVNCPTCGATVVWESRQRWRPFCSERCRLIDLGAWADESQRLPIATGINEADDIIIDDSLIAPDEHPTRN